MKTNSVLARLLVDDRGQDVIEYGLLAAIIGIAGVVTLPLVEEAMLTAYDDWTSGAYDQWCPDDPGGGATCSEE